MFLIFVSIWIFKTTCKQLLSSNIKKDYITKVNSIICAVQPPKFWSIALSIQEIFSHTLNI